MHSAKRRSAGAQAPALEPDHPMLKAKKLSAGGSGGFSALAGYYEPGQEQERTPERAMDEYFRPDLSADIPAQ